MKTKKKVLIVSMATLICVISVCIYYVFNEKPLMMDGLTGYHNQQNHIIISLVNKGISDISVQEVTVNKGEAPTKAQLVISYTSQLVAGGIDNDPFARTVELDEEPLHPELSIEEKQKAYTNKTVPIHYGIRLINNEVIESVAIKYKYFGITFTKIINLDTWPESNID